MGVYRIFDEGDHNEMGDGGMMTKAPHMPVSCWNFYFNVDSINAAIKRVESGGGKVLNGPMQVPGGSWIVNGQDPQGAMFSLVSNERMSHTGLVLTSRTMRLVGLGTASIGYCKRIWIWNWGSAQD